MEDQQPYIQLSYYGVVPPPNLYVVNGMRVSIDPRSTLALRLRYARLLQKAKQGREEGKRPYER